MFYLFNDYPTKQEAGKHKTYLNSIGERETTRFGAKNHLGSLAGCFFIFGPSGLDCKELHHADARKVSFFPWLSCF